MRLKFIVLTLFVNTWAIAQKQPLHHGVYDGWNNITNTTQSLNGKLTAIQTDPQEGDGFVEVFQDNKAIKKLQRAYQPAFTADGQYLLVLVKPPYQETRAAKAAKKKKDDLPKDHFVSLNLRTLQTDTFKEVTGYSHSMFKSHWVALKIAKKKPAKKSEAKTTDAHDNDEESKSDKDSKAFDMVLLRVSDKAQHLLFQVSEFVWADSATVFYYALEAKDSTQKPGVWAFETASQKISVRDTGRVTYKNLSCDATGDWLSFMSTPDSLKADVRRFDWHMYHKNKRRWLRANLWNDTLVLSDAYKPVFDRSGKVVFFGVMRTPVVPPKDTLTPPDELVKLDIWGWQDPLINPMQQKRLDADKKFSYRMAYLIEGNKYVPLANEAVPEVRIDLDQLTPWVVGYNNKPYQIQRTWESESKFDVWLLNVFDGKKRRIATALPAIPSISPDGEYAFWFDAPQKKWMIYNIKKRTTQVANAACPYPVHEEDWDLPIPASAYGQAGWTPDDKYFVFYDRYDLWAFDPEEGTLVDVTKGWGRAAKTRLRKQKKNEEDRTFDVTAKQYLQGLNEKNKEASLFVMEIWEAEPQQLMAGPYQILNFEKALRAEVFLHRRGNFQQYPEVYRTTSTIGLGQKLTHTNPQQDQYNWATVEPVSWTSYNQIPLEGLLYKPEDFDSTKKYPMLIYFYETHAEGIHRHMVPQPSWSIINITYYASNGYLVFVPDIKYQIGLPGPSAYDCILSGVDYLLKNPWVDSTKMAIQGQSWGGYQVAYLVTQTNRFAAAMAGAPVSNMFSAYGGIRWGSGMARAFQYEQGQSRIGQSPWEAADLYERNSPIFFADRVQTPLLIMHNDQDEAVPWYQGIEYYVALRRLQKPSWMLVYNGEAHNLKKRHNRKDLTVRMQQFFDHYLKGAPQPPWMEHGVPALDKGIKTGF